MKTGAIHRDIVHSEAQPEPDARDGRAHIAVIGIDRYRAWNRLYNNRERDAMANARVRVVPTATGFALAGQF